MFLGCTLTHFIPEATYVSRENEVFEDNSFQHLDGDINVFELREHLRDKGVKFSDCLDKEFYNGLKPEQCEFTLLGDWFVSADCGGCNWSVDNDSVEKTEFKAVIPKMCPKCDCEVRTTSKKPERFNQKLDTQEMVRYYENSRRSVPSYYLVRRYCYQQ